MEVISFEKWWAFVDSNYRPQSYQLQTANNSRIIYAIFDNFRQQTFSLRQFSILKNPLDIPLDRIAKDDTIKGVE